MEVYTESPVATAVQALEETLGPHNVIYDPYDYSAVHQRLPLRFVNERGVIIHGDVKVADSGDVILVREDQDVPDLLIEHESDHKVHARVTKRRRKTAPVKRTERPTTVQEMYSKRNELQHSINQHEIEFLRNPTEITQTLLAAQRAAISELEARIVVES
jgi:hypothetical protein